MVSRQRSHRRGAFSCDSAWNSGAHGTSTPSFASSWQRRSTAFTHRRNSEGTSRVLNRRKTYNIGSRGMIQRGKKGICGSMAVVVVKVTPFPSGSSQHSGPTPAILATSFSRAAPHHPNTSECHGMPTTLVSICFLLFLSPLTPMSRPVGSGARPHIATHARPACWDPASPPQSGYKTSHSQTGGMPPPSRIKPRPLSWRSTV